MATKFTPLHDRILVRRVEESETTRGGIIIPDSAKDKPQEGEVISVGRGKSNDEGKVFPLAVKAGDRILFGKYSGTEIKIDGEEYIIMREEEVLGILEGAARSSRTRLIGGRGAFSPAELASDLLEDSGAVALASSLTAEFAIAANFVALRRLTSGFPRVGWHLVRGPAGASVAFGNGGHSAMFGSPG